MVKRSLILAVVLGFGVVGCADMQPSGSGGAGFGPSPGCDGHGACHVIVDVTNCVITLNPDPLPVPEPNNIFWDLNFMSSFYQFPDDGVKFKTANTTFDLPEVQANGKRFKWHDKYTVKGPFPYGVKVQRLTIQGWVDCPPLDPTIVNG